MGYPLGAWSLFPGGSLLPSNQLPFTSYWPELGYLYVLKLANGREWNYQDYLRPVDLKLVHALELFGGSY